MISKADRQMAESILTTVDRIEGANPAVWAEINRVNCLTIPLALLIRDGYVATLTAEGKAQLAGIAPYLRDVLSLCIDHPGISVRNLHALTDAQDVLARGSDTLPPVRVMINGTEPATVPADYWTGQDATGVIREVYTERRWAEYALFRSEVHAISSADGFAVTLGGEYRARQPFAYRQRVSFTSWRGEVLTGTIDRPGDGSIRSLARDYPGETTWAVRVDLDGSPAYLAASQLTPLPADCEDCQTTAGCNCNAGNR